MTRYYPLIKHQFKNMKFLMLLLPALLAWYAFTFYSNMRSVYYQTLFGTMYYSNYSRNIFYSYISFNTVLAIFIFWIAVVCAMQSYHEKKPSVVNFISYLPYKRINLISVRILTTICVYTVCIFALGVALVLMRKHYFDLFIIELYSTINGGELFASFDTPFMIVKSLFVLWVTVTIFYLSATLSQMVVSNVFLACAIGGFTPFFPTFFIHYFHGFLYNSFGYTSAFLRKIEYMLSSAHFSEQSSHKLYYTAGADYSVAQQPLNGMFPVRLSTLNVSNFVTTNNLYFVVLVACAAILLVVCLFVYSKLICFANYGDLIAFRKASVAFSFFGGLCCAMLAANFFKGAVVTFSVLFVAFVISYLAFSKLAGRGGVNREKISSEK